MTPKGQYADGHEREDVVQYRQEVFLPQMIAYFSRMRRWIEEHGWDIPPPVIRAIVVWFHDESTFYAHDHRVLCWVPLGTKPVPYAKGEGASLMIAHFVSADYGWLDAPDDTETACVVFKAGSGAGRDGYFTNEEILDQFEKAMYLVMKYWPADDHVFVYDNATTHRKREDCALSASKMTKWPSDNFFVEVNIKGADGKPVYGSDRKLLKEKRWMENTFFDGVEQSLYFADDHPIHPGKFKGMAQILTERGYDVSRKKAQCSSKFGDCPKGAKDCCCWRMLYNKPDFVTVESRLETAARNHGFKVLFLPKFHCELNFIEQCWDMPRSIIASRHLHQRKLIWKRTSWTL